MIFLDLEARERAAEKVEKQAKRTLLQEVNIFSFKLLFFPLLIPFLRFCEICVVAWSKIKLPLLVLHISPAQTI